MLIKSDNLLNTLTRPPAEIERWLKHQLSLTAKLKSDAGDARLEVLKQHWVRPNWWDKYTLGLQASLVMHRDILMSAKQNPCWFARTIVPELSYQTVPAFFARLKDESLGDLIFSETEVRREQMIHYAITQQSLEYYWLLPYLGNQKTALWSRLSVFTIAEKSPFYLLEVLLPDLLRSIT
ncbi:chorismate--pyruvate lyase family protein [Legionella feeleii]|uniref:4-hydroxybenzoate synthetase n=1 Tax=Legionella feeleii TaxID=453 RepID=A0A0W0TI84_9GAMM|nr:chorismate lyase [Legionella feeleii]KTC95314.1 4-hydroxybenzoate synthetase [Legionella feeleii]SPX61174.1 4-hydroxybenzoate synthetase [Legionella feeleii]